MFIRTKTSISSLVTISIPPPVLLPLLHPHLPELDPSVTAAAHPHLPSVRMRWNPTSKPMESPDPLVDPCNPLPLPPPLLPLLPLPLRHLHLPLHPHPHPLVHFGHFSAASPAPHWNFVRFFLSFSLLSLSFSLCDKLVWLCFFCSGF